MKYLEELAKRIKGTAEDDSGAVDQTLMVGTMTDNGCNIGEIELDKDDLIIPGNLASTLTAGDEVVVAQVTEEKFAVLISTVEHSRPAKDADKHYTHIQIVASSTWTINHNLGKYPSVSVVDSAGTSVIGQVDYINANTCKLYFTGAFSGKAFLN